MNKINWKVRFKNKVWLGSFLSLIIGFVFGMLRLFDIYPEITEDRIIMTVNNILTFLGLFGVLIDPTTEGIFDSERALGYTEPWSDKKVEEEFDNCFTESTDESQESEDTEEQPTDPNE